MSCAKYMQFLLQHLKSNKLSSSFSNTYSTNTEHFLPVIFKHELHVMVRIPTDILSMFKIKYACSICYYAHVGTVYMKRDNLDSFLYLVYYHQINRIRISTFITHSDISPRYFPQTVIYTCSFPLTPHNVNTFSP